MRAPAGRQVDVLALLAAAAAALMSLLVMAPAASAHGGEGNLALVRMTPVEATAGSWEIEVELSFLSDGHPVDDATVTVAGDSAAGSVLTPVTMQPVGAGRFSATVELPAGTWNLRVTSVEPPAQLSLEPVTVAEAEKPSTTGTSSADQSASIVPVSTTAPEAERPEGAAGTDLTWPLLILVVLVGGGVLVWAVMSWLRYRSGVDRLN